MIQCKVITSDNASVVESIANGWLKLKSKDVTSTYVTESYIFANGYGQWSFTITFFYIE